MNFGGGEHLLPECIQDGVPGGWFPLKARDSSSGGLIAVNTEIAFDQRFSWSYLTSGIAKRHGDARIPDYRAIAMRPGIGHGRVSGP